MLSAKSNPASDGGGGGGGGGMVLGGVMVSMSATSAAADAKVDDPSKRIRKPYKLTKSRESWSDHEHDKFIEALQLLWWSSVSVENGTLTSEERLDVFDRDWKKIEAFVSSKTVIQIRSHAQKYFSKVQRNGSSEHIPPPRPKRKATHPYPQKTSKDVPTPSRPAIPFHASSLIERGYAPLTSMPETVSSWTQTSNNSSSTNLMNEITTNNYSAHDIPSSPNTYPGCGTFGQGNHAASHNGIYGMLQNIAVPLLSQPVIPLHTSFLEQGHASLMSEKVSSWTHTFNTPSSGNVTNENMMNNCSGADSCPSPNAYPVGERSVKRNQAALHSGMSDLAEVYGFIGSIFDQNRSDQLEALNDMNPIDAETRMLLASYELEGKDVNPMNTEDCETDPFLFNAE